MEKNMEQTKSIKFLSQEKRYISSNIYTTDWSSAGTVLDASHLTAGNRYLLVSWFNCLSPGTQQGATKLSFDGGDDLTGADYQRHDTNSNFMSGEFSLFVACSRSTNRYYYFKKSNFFQWWGRRDRTWTVFYY